MTDISNNLALQAHETVARVLKAVTTGGVVTASEVDQLLAAHEVSAKVLPQQAPAVAFGPRFDQESEVYPEDGPLFSQQ